MLCLTVYALLFSQVMLLIGWLEYIYMQVLDDSRMGDNFIGQYSCPLRFIQQGACLHSINACCMLMLLCVFIARVCLLGYRHAPLVGLTGEIVPGASVFVRVSV